MSNPSPPPGRPDAFRTLYEAVYPDLLRFAQRRTDTFLAEDAVAEASLVLWRRFDEVPQNRDDARAWAFGILRNIMLNTHRGDQRRQALGIRLANIPTEASSDSHEDAVTSRIDLGRAWHLLSEVHQEALGLAVFEDLPAPQAAAVLGISPVAFRLRLSRARRALRLLLNHFPHTARTPAVSPERTATP
ncbi:RNA polymerase sigma factor [Arthrobacter agilis]|nr:sigma-70 family RNA polymerase sigma factor [Arthrobacter agilis]